MRVSEGGTGMDTRRWVVVAIVVVLLVTFVAWARGPEHRRGDEVGARGAAGVLTAPAQT
jgi:hypothetical protein